MKAKEIINEYTALSDLLKKKLPVRMSLIVGRNLKKIEPINTEILEKRDELIKQYAEHDDDGNPIRKGNEIKLSSMDFYRDQKELLDTDFAVEFDKISMSVLERCDTDDFDSPTGEEVAALECMLEE